MTEKGLKYLSDINYAIELIEEFVSQTANFSEYVKDHKTQSAVERQLGIIGEAVNKFKIIHPEISMKYTKEIIGFRNRLIHAYDAIDNAIVWAVIKRHLPPLKNEVGDLMRK